VIGRHPLRSVDYATPVPSAQVKSAILLAALRADGRTTVREAVATRDHTERMLRARGVDVQTERQDLRAGEDGTAGVAITIVILAINFLGDGLTEALDSSLRKR